MNATVRPVSLTGCTDLARTLAKSPGQAIREWPESDIAVRRAAQRGEPLPDQALEEYVRWRVSGLQGGLKSVPP